MACAFQLNHEEHRRLENICDSDIGAGTNGGPEDVIAEESHGGDEDGGLGAVCGDDAVL